MATNDLLAYAPNLASTRNPFNYEKVEQIARDISTSWLSLNQITEQLNLVDDESQDIYLQNLELATRQAVEDYLGLSIFPVTYRVYYCASTLWGVPVSLDLPEVSQNTVSTLPGVTITSVGYWNNSTPSVFTLLSSSTYYYDPSGNKIVLTDLPDNINYSMTAPIIATYKTVANPIAQYPVVQQAGLLLLTHLYNNRSDTTGPIQHKIPFGFEQLLKPYKPLVM